MIYEIANKTSIGSKPLRIRFNIKGGIIRIYDVTRYLLLLCPEKHDAIYNTIRYLINLKRGIAYITLMPKSRLFLINIRLENNILTLHNVITLINLILSKEKNRYY